jgi:hypothetical protein
MHPSVMSFAREVLNEEWIAGRAVLEAGSYDVNGSLRGTVKRFNPSSYVATDMRKGPNVDVVVTAEDLPADVCDVLICTEMLEHARDWRASMYGLTRALRVGGQLLLTTRGPGFPLHGFPEDYWRFPVATMSEIVTALGYTTIRCERDSDPGSPGVFVLATKTGVAGDLAGIEAVPVQG